MNDILDRMDVSDKERFWSKVDVGAEDACWEWKGVKDRCGYGQFSIGTRRTQVKRRAHRIAFVLSVARDIEDGSIVLHRCDNPACCNPKHLSVGSHQDNMNDMKTRGRAATVFGYAKLNWEIVDEIRASDLPQSVLAERYGVSKATISEIVNEKIWRNEHRHVCKGLS